MSLREGGDSWDPRHLQEAGWGRPLCPATTASTCHCAHLPLHPPAATSTCPCIHLPLCSPAAGSTCHAHTRSGTTHHLHDTFTCPISLPRGRNTALLRGSRNDPLLPRLSLSTSSDRRSPGAGRHLTIIITPWLPVVVFFQDSNKYLLNQLSLQNHLKAQEYQTLTAGSPRNITRRRNAGIRATSHRSVQALAAQGEATGCISAVPGLSHEAKIFL